MRHRDNWHTRRSCDLASGLNPEDGKPLERQQLATPYPLKRTPAAAPRSPTRRAFKIIDEPGV